MKSGGVADSDKIGIGNGVAAIEDECAVLYPCVARISILPGQDEGAVIVLYEWTGTGNRARERGGAIAADGKHGACRA